MARLFGSAAASRGRPAAATANPGSGSRPLRALDLSQILKRDGAHRFLISADAVVENHAFLTYGARFALLLGLPERPVPMVPMMPQLPERYRAVFAKGCADAIAGQAPVRLSGVFADEDGQREVYRAAFTPVTVSPNSLTQLVYGDFNRLTLYSVHRRSAGEPG